MPPKTEQSPENPPAFTAPFQALEEILERFRQGTPSLEESLSLFEEGVQHIKTCQNALTRAKGTVEELVQSLQEGGQIVTRPFDINGNE